MKLVRALICLIVLAASPVLLLQGWSNARIPPGPAVWNGFWLADVAGAFLLAEESQGRLQLSVTDRGLELATEAYKKEPFATDGLFLLAVNYRTEGRPDEVDRLLDLGLSLDKRSRQLGVLELERAALEGNYPSVFATIDRLTVTSPRLVAEFVTPLSSSLEQDGVLPTLRDALNQEPVWADAFWRSVPASSAGVTRLYELRQMTDAGTSVVSDGYLLAALVRESLYQEAFDFWDSLDGDHESGEIAFLATTQFEPIGWRATISGDRTFSQLGVGQFEIFVEEQTSGELARQLIRTEPGSYAFSAEITPGSESRNLEVTLECATDPNISLASQDLTSQARWSTTEDCRIYWIVLSGSAWDRRAALRVSISNMAFRRVS